LSKTIENTTSSPSVATDNSDPTNVDLDNAGIGPSGALNASKKRKADAVDDSVLTSSLSPAGSNSEPLGGKRKKSKEEEKRGKRSKKKGKDEDKEYMRN
jgi:hypothetical protein